jgi:NADH-quinone oxidoreductase subunit G
MLEPTKPAADESAAGSQAGSDESAVPEVATALEGQEELLLFLSQQSLDELAAAAGVDSTDLRDTARLLVGAESLVIVYGERIGHGARGAGALAALADLAMLAGVDGGESSGLFEVPLGTNARGLREVGCLPGLGPGLSDAPGGLAAREAAEAAAAGELGALYLLHCDPVREYPGGELWERALGAAFVVAHHHFVTPSLARYADVVFPAESYAEKEGTVTHPDGRVQRLRPSIGHPGEVTMEWQLLIEIARRLGLDLLYLTAGMVLDEIVERVSLYSGLTLDEIGGDGVRWQEREFSLAAARETLGELRFGSPSPLPPPLEPADRALVLAPVPDLWASWETEHSPALDFLAAEQELRVHPSDAERLGLFAGEQVEVASSGHAVRATVRLREAARPGSALLTWGTRDANANVLVGDSPVIVQIKRPDGGKPADGF